MEAQVGSDLRRAKTATTGPKKKKAITPWKIISRLLFFVGIVVAWEVGVKVTKIPQYLLPGPSAISVALIGNLGLIIKQSYATIYETILGFLLGAAVGIGLAILLVYSSYFRATILPTLVAFNAFPKAAIAPLLVVWFGLGLESKIVMAFVISFFPIVVNAARGLGDIEPDLLNLTRLMSASEWQTLQKIRFPHALPGIFDAFKVSVPLSIVGAIIGEFVGAKEGIGYLILLATSVLNAPLVFAALFVIAVISLVLFGVVIFLEKIILRWRPSERRQ